MEPVTHILTGATLARTGLNRRAAYATVAMAIAAEFPDIDTLWSLRGSVAGFEHHRGITHTFVGLPVEALVIVGGVFAFHKVRCARRRTRPSAKPLTLAPVRWGTLYLFTLLALLSHILLDYTNNYGVRPFFPFNPHWYAASIVFIFDPWIFGLLVVGLVAPSLFGLIGSEVGARRKPFRGAGWAVFALVGIVSLWLLRYAEHDRALAILQSQNPEAPASSAAMPDAAPATDASAAAPPEPAPTYLSPVRVLASPDPISPFRWYGATDFGPAAGSADLAQLSTLNTLQGSMLPSDNFLARPPLTPALAAAEHTRLGRDYFDWSPMPILSVQQADDPDAPPGAQLVLFEDPRFMGGPALLQSRRRPPITGSVLVDAQNHVLEQEMDSRP